MKITFGDVFFIYLFPVALLILTDAFIALYILIFPGTKLKVDLDRYFARTGKCRNFYNLFFALLGNNGIQAIVLHRLSHGFYRWKLGFVANVLRRLCIFFTGIDISPSAAIGEGFEIYHGYGLVIGRTVEIGKNVLVCQGVTIGYSHNGRPVIGDNVKIFAGAKVVGGVKIGSDCLIGANAVVTENVQDRSKVVGPKSIVVSNGGSG